MTLTPAELPPLPDASAWQLLLGWRPGGAAYAALALGLGYGWLWRRHGWPAWRLASFVAGLALLVSAGSSQAADYALNSMALYMGRLMLLAEAVPPLLLLGLPAAVFRSRGALARFVLDPVVALAVWTAVIVVWNLPFSFNASLIGNTAPQLLPTLYLIGGLLSWAVSLDRLALPLPRWQRGVYGLLASFPMMLVGLVWLFSPEVLYAPYVGAVCLWNLTPLQNQQLAGVIMLAAGAPLMALAAGQLGRTLLARLDEGERRLA